MVDVAGQGTARFPRFGAAQIPNMPDFDFVKKLGTTARGTATCASGGFGEEDAAPEGCQHNEYEWL